MKAAGRHYTTTTNQRKRNVVETRVALCVGVKLGTSEVRPATTANRACQPNAPVDNMQPNHTCRWMDNTALACDTGEGGDFVPNLFRGDKFRCRKNNFAEAVEKGVENVADNPRGVVVCKALRAHDLALLVIALDFLLQISWRT